MANIKRREVKGTLNEITLDPILLTGTGASAPTLTQGKGVTVGYTSTGVYTLTFDEAYPAILGVLASLCADAPEDLLGHTVICSLVSSKVIEVRMANASDAAHDLAAAEYLTILPVWKYRDV